MSPYLRVKLSLLALCLIAVAGSHIYFAGVDSGMEASDTEALAAYTHFASQMHAETHKPKAHEAQTIWAAIDGSK